MYGQDILSFISSVDLGYGVRSMYVCMEAKATLRMGGI